MDSIRGLHTLSAGQLLAGCLLLVFASSGVSDEPPPGSPSFSGQYRILDGKNAIEWLIKHDYIDAKHYPKKNFETFRAGLATNPKPGPHGLVAIMAQGWDLTGPMKGPIRNPVIIIDLPPKGDKKGLVVSKARLELSGVHDYRGIPGKVIKFKSCKVRFEITNNLPEDITWKEGWFEHTDIEGKKKVEKMGYQRPELGAGKSTPGGGQVDCPEREYKGEWKAWGHGVLPNGTVVKWEISGTCGP